jgi:hypothetical protein
VQASAREGGSRNGCGHIRDPSSDGWWGSSLRATIARIWHESTLGVWLRGVQPKGADQDLEPLTPAERGALRAMRLGMASGRPLTLAEVSRRSGFGYSSIWRACHRLAAKGYCGAFGPKRVWVIHWSQLPHHHRKVALLAFDDTTPDGALVVAPMPRLGWGRTRDRF